jgi:two-component system chemotaxis response regulator CheY
MKILITDDSAFMRQVVQNALKDLGAEFLQAENGDVAVELYREYTPDLVLLDVIMPVKNGVMALQEIKEINPDAKVMIVTSVGQEEMISKAKELGATDFVSKPFQAAKLQELVKKHLV